ncbi:MAG: MBL fold metallo-hydrolase, partial [Myxococcota bacterium]
KTTMDKHFSLKIHACRGSFPVAGGDYERYGGATSCVTVQAGTRSLIFDAGTGIINHGKELVHAMIQTGEPIDAYLFVTHMHLDHLFGLPYFAPMYIPSATVHLWGPRMGHFETFEDAIDTLISPPFFPVPLHEMNAVKSFHDISEAHVLYFLKGCHEPVLCRGMHPSDKASVPNPEDVEVAVHVMRGFNHPKSGVLIYKIVYDGRSVVYATDTEGYVHGDQRLIKFAKGAEVLLHDAMYTSDRYISMPGPTQGYGHSTVEIAARVAEQAGVRQLVLFHHDPASTDADLDAVARAGREAFDNTLCAADGLVLEL